MGTAGWLSSAHGLREAGLSLASSSGKRDACVVLLRGGTGVGLEGGQAQVLEGLYDS